MAWFLVPYKTRAARPKFRYCSMDDFTALIRADGGNWSETEVMGNHAVVKVAASVATLTAIAASPGVTRLPRDVLTDSLAALTAPQRNALRSRIEALGYGSAEITAALSSDLRTRTLGDVLRFVASRRLKPRWDESSGSVVLDGAVAACRPIADVDAAVS